jgi:hypothetical protein
MVTLREISDNPIRNLRETLPEIPLATASAEQAPIRVFAESDRFLLLHDLRIPEKLEKAVFGHYLDRILPALFVPPTFSSPDIPNDPATENGPDCL